MLLIRKLRRLELHKRSGRYLLYALGEIVLIVAGILIALQIGNWNIGRLERIDQRENLMGLLVELQSSRSQLGRALNMIEGCSEGTRSVLRLMGPNPDSISANKLSELFNQSLDVGIVDPRKPTLNNLISSGELGELPPDLQAQLEGWPPIANDIYIDFGHLERNREIDLFQAIAESGYPLRAIMMGLIEGVPDSAFSKDPSALLSNVQIESIFSVRLTRSTILEIIIEEAISHLDQSINLIELELNH